MFVLYLAVSVQLEKFMFAPSLVLCSHPSFIYHDERAHIRFRHVLFHPPPLFFFLHQDEKEHVPDRPSQVTFPSLSIHQAEKAKFPIVILQSSAPPYPPIRTIESERMSLFVLSPNPIIPVSLPFTLDDKIHVPGRPLYNHPCLPIHSPRRERAQIPVCLSSRLILPISFILPGRERIRSCFYSPSSYPAPPPPPSTHHDLKASFHHPLPILSPERARSVHPPLQSCSFCLSPIHQDKREREREGVGVRCCSSSPHAILPFPPVSPPFTKTREREREGT